jgi:hypothetical protein
MLKASMIGIVGFMIGAGTVAIINWTKSDSQIMPAATVSMPTIDELHVKTHAQSLPDQTVKEPF